MIINTEIRDALTEQGEPTRQLVLSYVNAQGNVSFLTYNIPVNQLFQWRYAKRGDTPDRNFISWDFKRVVRAPIKGGYIDDQRIQQIILDLIAANPQVNIINDLNLPNTYFCDIEVDVDDNGFPDADSVRNPVNTISWVNNDAVIVFGRKYMSPEQIEWIKEQTAKAKEDGQMMFAMNHYPLLAGQPILSLISSAVQKNAAEAIDVLADNGVNLVFTGHMHNQSINEKIIKSGNRFYDVCTGSIIAAPASMRLVTIEDKNTIDIKTEHIPDFEWDTNGKSCKQYLSDMFDSMILNMLEDMRDNPERMLHKLSIKNDKLKPVFGFAGKKLDTITVGKTARLLAVKCDKSIKNMLLKDFICKLVRDVFSGNQTMKEGTPEGDTFLRVLKRFNFILKKIKLKNTDGEPVDLIELLKNSAGNYDIDDYNAVLKLN